MNHLVSSKSKQKLSMASLWDSLMANGLFWMMSHTIFSKTFQKNIKIWWMFKVMHRHACWLRSVQRPETWNLEFLVFQTQKYSQTMSIIFQDRVYFVEKIAPEITLYWPWNDTKWPRNLGLIVRVPTILRKKFKNFEKPKHRRSMNKPMVPTLNMNPTGSTAIQVLDHATA